MSDSLRPHGPQPTRILHPWDFSRQEYWSGVPFPSPGDLPDSGIEPGSPASQADALLSEPPGKSQYQYKILQCTLHVIFLKYDTFLEHDIFFLLYFMQELKPQHLTSNAMRFVGKRWIMLLPFRVAFQHQGLPHIINRRKTRPVLISCNGELLPFGMKFGHQFKNLPYSRGPQTSLLFLRQENFMQMNDSLSVQLLSHV